MVTHKLAFLFPGQGSQFVGMARQAAERSSSAQTLLAKADDLLGFNLSELMFNGPEETLKQTSNTQPALFVASAASLELMRAKSLHPSFTAGHSLGEYSALYAAGVLSFETALMLVRERGLAMQAAGESNPGTMAAVIGLNESAVVQLCRDSSTENEVCVPANFNTETQIVISGHKPAVERACDKAKAAGAMKVVMLNVSGAFHSPLMSEAVKRMESKIRDAEFRDAEVPVFTNVDAEPTTKGDDFRRKLIEQIDHPVRWHDTLVKMGVSDPSAFVEVGSGKVLGTMAKKLHRKKVVLFTDEWDAVETFSASPAQV
jgi:[acyl-carrier-protein] S-malonyltransferase